MKKITLLFAIVAMTFTTTNAQNYGLKTTGDWGDSFSSNQIGALLSNQTAFTIEFWYQIETFTPNAWIFRVEDTASNRIGLYTTGADNGGVYVRIGDGTNHGQQAFWNTDLKAGNGWNHVALTFDSGVHKLYINGVERVTGAAISGTYPTSTGDLSTKQFQIGWNTGANIDELRITKGTALSTIDITKSSTPTNFDAYFDFNANERPTGAAASNSAIVNIGSDATVLGQINNFGTTYEIIDNPLSVKSFDKVNNLQIYPNPASSHVNIQLPFNTSGKVSVYNVMGKLILEKTVTNQNEVQVNTNTLSKGVHLLTFENETIKKVSKLIVR